MGALQSGHLGTVSMSMSFTRQCRQPESSNARVTGFTIVDRLQSKRLHYISTFPLKTSIDTSSDALQRGPC